MKLLVVIPFFEPYYIKGGIVGTTVPLCRELVRQGHEVTVYTLSHRMEGVETPPVNRPIVSEGVTIHYFKPWMTRRFFFTPDILPHALRVQKFDVIKLAAALTFLNIPVSVMARSFGVPVLISPHGYLKTLLLSMRRNAKNRLYFRLIEHRHIEIAHGIQLTSEIEREEARALGIVTPTCIIPNPVETVHLERLPSREEARAALGISPDRRVILYLGRLDWVKALDVLLEGVARLKRDCPEALLILAGPDFGEERKLRDLTRRLRLEDSVRFTGYVGNEMRRKLLAACDLMTLTSYGENFGLSAAEGMAAGKPVLVSPRVGLVHDILRSGAGRVCEVCPSGVADGLKDLLRLTEEERARMGEAGRELVTRFRLPEIARLFTLACEDVRSGRRSPELQWEIP